MPHMPPRPGGDSVTRGDGFASAPPGTAAAELARLRESHANFSREARYLKAQMERIAAATTEPAILSIALRALADGESDKWVSEMQRRLAARVDALIADGSIPAGLAGTPQAAWIATAATARRMYWRCSDCGGEHGAELTECPPAEYPG